MCRCWRTESRSLWHKLKGDWSSGESRIWGAEEGGTKKESKARERGWRKERRSLAGGSERCAPGDWKLPSPWLTDFRHWGEREEEAPQCSSIAAILQALLHVSMSLSPLIILLVRKEILWMDSCQIHSAHGPKTHRAITSLWQLC